MARLGQKARPTGRATVPKGKGPGRGHWQRERAGKEAIVCEDAKMLAGGAFLRKVRLDTFLPFYLFNPKNFLAGVYSFGCPPHPSIIQSIPSSRVYPAVF